MPIEYVNKNQLASSCNIPYSAVTKYMKTGIIPAAAWVREGFKYKINKALAIKAIQSYRDSTSVNQETRGDNLPRRKQVKSNAKSKLVKSTKKLTTSQIAPPVHESRQIKEHFKALEAKHDYEVARKQWVLVTDVERDVFTAWRNMRDNLLALVPQLGPVLAAEQDKKVIESMLSDKFRQVLVGADKWR